MLMSIFLGKAIYGNGVGCTAEQVRVITEWVSHINHMTGQDKSEPGTGRLVWSKGLHSICTAADPAYNLHLSFSVCITRWKEGHNTCTAANSLEKMGTALFKSKCSK